MNDKLAEHTPGPWTVLKSDGEEWPQKRLSVAADVASGRARSLAISPRYPNGDLEANFRLIAAAPDLLAALVAAEDADAGTLDPTSRNLHHHRLHDVIQLRRAAIAKAKGSRMAEPGLWGKYDVSKNGEPVEGCFVLRPERDPAAAVALEAYAAATGNNRLRADLEVWLERIAKAKGTE